MAPTSASPSAAPPGLLQRLVDHAHAVIGVHGDEVRPHPAIGLLERGNERLVLRAVMRGRIGLRGDDAERGVANRIEDIIFGQAAIGDDFHAGFIEPPLDHLAQEDRADAGRNEHHDRIGLGVGHALKCRRKIVRRQRHAQGVDDLATGRFKTLLEIGLDLDARRVVGDDRDHGLDAVLRGPVGQRRDRLRHREAGANDVGRTLGDRRGSRQHRDLEHLGFGRERRNRKRAGRERKAGQHRNLVVDDQFLREALGVIGITAIIFDDKLDLLARDRVAILLHVEFCAGNHLLAGRRERTAQRHQKTDLDSVLRQCRRNAEQECGGEAADEDAR